MHKLSRFCRIIFACILLLLASIGTIVTAQERMTIQATANGTSTQMGKIANVNIYIEQYSTVEDRNSLINAFKKSGQDGMVKVLEDMKPKGRIRFASGGVGNDIKYIFELPPGKTGRRLRLVTDRTLHSPSYIKEHVRVITPSARSSWSSRRMARALAQCYPRAN